jgi:hypothetical protein
VLITTHRRAPTGCLVASSSSRFGATSLGQSHSLRGLTPPDATEEQLIGLWLHGKSANTIRAYRRDIAAFRAFIGKPIRLSYLGDLQRYADALAGSPASCARRLLVVKSLL